MTKQTTLRGPVTKRGLTVFSGSETVVSLEPAPADHGIVFLVDGVRVPARIENVAPEIIGRTALQKEGAFIAMVEHLLAALHGLQVDNVLIRVDGNEIPMLDGSAKLWVEAIQHTGIVELPTERVQLCLKQPVYWSGRDARCIAIPARQFTVTYAWYAPQSEQFRSAFWEGVINPESFCEELQSARTFGFEEEVKKAQELGFIRGASLERGILIRDDKIVNAEGLRFPDEIVRHKALDVVGDLALVGLNVAMHVIAVRSGHIGNIALARAIHAKLQEEIADEPNNAKTATRSEADREDTATPLPVFADR